MAEVGKSRRDIALTVTCIVKTVGRIVHAFCNEKRIHDAPHSRRPLSTTTKEDLWIVAAAIDRPTITLDEISQEPRFWVSEKTNKTAPTKLHSRVVCQKPLLTPRHKELRLEFVRSVEAGRLQR